VELFLIYFDGKSGSRLAMELGMVPGIGERFRLSWVD